MAKKGKVPKVLWRLFQKRALTLVKTIVALCTPLATVVKCCCRGNRSKCLGCCANDPISFLLRENDSSEYRGLLNRCFVVVSENAPSLPYFSPACHWSQIEIVRRTLEMMLCEQSHATNVICNEYDESTRSSTVVELLTSPAWSLLLRRVGDDLMVYLLKYTSIFLPLPCMKYYQLTGLPVSNLCYNVSTHATESDYSNSSRDPSNGFQVQALQRKRKRTLKAESTSEKPQVHSSLDNDISLSPRTAIRNRGKHLRQFSWRRRKKCSCCSVLRSFQKVAADVQIDRQSMFYKLDRASSIVPGRHILNSLMPNISGANALLMDIFGLAAHNIDLPICPHSKDCSGIKQTCLRQSLLKLLIVLIRKARYFPHMRLRDKYFSNSSGEVTKEGPSSMLEHVGSKLEDASNVMRYNCTNAITRNRTSQIAAQLFQSINSYCPRQQIVAFIWAVCRNIVPLSMLGSPSSRRTLRRNISKFIWLRRFEKFSLNQCMDKLKISGFSFLFKEYCCEISDVTKQQFLERWIFWFFSCLVVPLIQANFYVTEVEHGKQQIFYYHKSVWDRLMNESVSSFKDQYYSLLNKESVEKIVSKRRYGFSRVRLLPKENGIRPLANLSASSEMLMRMRKQFKRFMPVNSDLRDLHVVLKDVQLKKPKALGASVFDYNDVYKKLRPFLSLLKCGSGTIGDVFIVVADVAKAFDSVSQDKLFSVMKDILTDGYCLKKSQQVVCRKQSLQVQYNWNVAHQDISNLSTKVSSFVGTRSPHSILVNQVGRKTMKRNDLHNDLEEHIKRNVLQIYNKFYRQDIGIPQGSILSTLLCSFYYGDIENKIILPLLEKINKEMLPSSQYLLLRFIDDIIFISTSEHLARTFFRRLKRGFHDYNCHMNADKFCMNFDVGVNQRGLKRSREYINGDGTLFLQWCGLFINSNTLEVQVDYTRYLDAHLSSTITVCRTNQPFQTLKAKLCDYLRPKCHPLFYDSIINSTTVVRINIYQAFLIAAMKFHCYIHDLSDIGRLKAISYLNIINNSLRHMFNLIKKRMHSMVCDSDFRPVLQLKRREVEWLGLTAFTRALSRKQSRYKELLLLLKSWSSSIFGENVPNVLMDAVHDSHSAVLWKIKY